MIDYLIIGQGISGTFLSYYLVQAGKTVLVIDDGNPNAASKVASGVINPVTGRRIVKTWLIDELLPFAEKAYADIGKTMGKQLLRQCNVLDIHATRQMKEAFDSRQQQEPTLLKQAGDETQWQQYFRYNYGIGEINPCLLVNMRLLLQSWRIQLTQLQMLQQEKFDWGACHVADEGITYKGITARKLICCDGVNSADNPYFNLLPFALNKGEALIAEIPGLPPTNVYKQGISIVPLENENQFWIGSTYEWNYTDVQPTRAFIDKTTAQLNYLLKLPYTITDHLAAERPANIERRPFVGLHPVHSNVGILNGMGTKGCSLAPYFAWQLTQHLLHGTPIQPLADVQRFKRILSKR